MVGTGTGIAEPSSTMAPRSDRCRTSNAESTRSPSRGACCRAAPTTGNRRGRWPLLTSISFVAVTELVLLFTPPFDESDVNPGYIKGYLPGVHENGGQYTHGAIWSVLGFAALGDGDKAGELFAILNPLNHSSTRAGVYRYKVEPYVMAADIYAEPPHTGRGGWTWYTGAAGWMYQAGFEWILGFRLRGTSLLLRSMHPKQMAGVPPQLPLSQLNLRDHRREPARRQPWSCVRRTRRTTPARRRPHHPTRRRRHLSPSADESSATHAEISRNLDPRFLIREAARVELESVPCR